MVGNDFRRICNENDELVLNALDQLTGCALSSVVVDCDATCWFSLHKSVTSTVINDVLTARTSVDTPFCPL